jgi:hypothetical protein
MSKGRRELLENRAAKIAAKVYEVEQALAAAHQQKLDGAVIARHLAWSRKIWMPWLVFMGGTVAMWLAGTASGQLNLSLLVAVGLGGWAATKTHEGILHYRSKAIGWRHTQNRMIQDWLSLTTWGGLFGPLPGLNDERILRIIQNARTANKKTRDHVLRVLARLRVHYDTDRAAALITTQEDEQFITELDAEDKITLTPLQVAVGDLDVREVGHLLARGDRLDVLAPPKRNSITKTLLHIAMETEGKGDQGEETARMLLEGRAASKEMDRETIFEMLLTSNPALWLETMISGVSVVDHATKYNPQMDTTVARFKRRAALLGVAGEVVDNPTPPPAI